MFFIARIHLAVKGYVSVSVTDNENIRHHFRHNGHLNYFFKIIYLKMQKVNKLFTLFIDGSAYFKL